MELVQPEPDELELSEPDFGVFIETRKLNF